MKAWGVETPIRSAEEQLRTYISGLRNEKGRRLKGQEEIKGSAT